MFSDPTLTTENDGPKLRGFRDSLVNDKLENNNMATAASSGTISRRPHLLRFWVNYPKEILDDMDWVPIRKVAFRFFVKCCKERDI